ncbi:uncharacterized protein C2845_PM17G09790 [Panicum miliaceum]|uniref:BAG domain-containing protein n=1 Tax=Panicum miliaceum TaxID=4540 RepID=A0A3L6Q0I3_PANMI|nr:uncharacterized protein C2845_PM17G09790 [Panicum miliaceum]
MASRRFFAYDPYDYYYAAPYHYPYPYYPYQQQPAPSRGAGGFFADAAPEPVSVAPRPRVESSKPVSIPVHFVGSDPDPEHGTAGVAAAMAPWKRAPSAEEAAVRVQAAARGLLARRSVRAVREVEREAEEAGAKIAREAEALRGDARARIAVGEALMRMLLRLDAVRGAREYRRRVTKRVLALQDAVDALEPKKAPEPAPEAVVEENESEVTAETADGNAGSELPDVEERSGAIEAKAVAETAADMEVDGGRADGEPDEGEETEQAHDAGNLDGVKPEGSDAEGEWEMVTEEPEHAAAPACRSDAPRPQEPAGAEIITTGTDAGAGGLDTLKVMEMVAALCERSAQQCAVIGALAERVDALERAVRRAEDAERRRRRAKKLRKEGEGEQPRLVLQRLKEIQR